MELSKDCKQRCPVTRNTRKAVAQFALEHAGATSPVEQARLAGLIERGNTLLRGLAAGCADGKPLSMRATEGDTIYTATICTSSNVPVAAEGEAYEPVTIRRAPADE